MKKERKQIIRVRITVFEDGESHVSYRPGLNVNRGTDRVESAVDTLVAALRRCQELPHVKDRVA